MRDSPLNHIRQIYRLTKEIYRPTKETYQTTKEIHRLTKEIHQVTKEICRPAKEIYQKAKEFYQVSKDGTLQMITNSINVSEHHNECGISPFGSLMASLRVRPSAPFGDNPSTRFARGQAWIVGPPQGTLAARAGQPAAYLR